MGPGVRCVIYFRATDGTLLIMKLVCKAQLNYNTINCSHTEMLTQPCGVLFYFIFFLPLIYLHLGFIKKLLREVSI